MGTVADGHKVAFDHIWSPTDQRTHLRLAHKVGKGAGVPSMPADLLIEMHDRIHAAEDT